MQNGFESFVGELLNVEVNEEDARSQMRDGLLEYTLSFWDAFVADNYGPDDAREFLDQDPEDHLDENDLLYQTGGFASSRPSKFSVKDVSGAPVVHFTADGDIILLFGAFSVNPSLTATSNSELLVKNSSGTVLMSVDASSGNLKIRGAKYESQSGLSASSGKELIFRHAADKSSNDQILLDASGNLKLRGVLVSGTVDVLE